MLNNIDNTTGNIGGKKLFSLLMVNLERLQKIIDYLFSLLMVNLERLPKIIDYFFSLLMVNLERLQKIIDYFFFPPMLLILHHLFL
jgi:hypothetical protein